jgi:molybdopterin molybdotransferase
MNTNSFRESLETVLSHSRPLPAEEIGFHQALGRVTAREVLAGADDPPVPKSAMDGFAVRAADTRGASTDNPVRLAYTEVVGAGHVTGEKVMPGRAVRLMTGAWLPEGADAVVKQEDTLPAGEGAFTVSSALREGENVVPAGARLRKGDVALPAGVPISPPALGMLASLGHTRVRVTRRPRVALLALGDELAEVGEPLAPGKLYVSNVYALEAKVRRYGGQPRGLGIAGDDPALIQRLLQPRLIVEGREDDPLGCEIVMTIGGSHGGDFDFAHHVLDALGAAVHFRRTRLNLGGSTLFATLGGTLLFGLAGTPVPALGGFELLVRPALWRMAGRAELEHPSVEARLTAPLRIKPGYTCFQPAWLAFGRDGAAQVTPLRERGEGGLPGSLLANALIRVPDDAEELPAGERVTAEWLGD